MKSISSEQTIGKVQRLLVVIIMSLALVFALTIFELFYQENRRIEEKNLSSFTMGNKKDIEYKIEYKGLNNKGSYFIKGWCIKPGIEYSYYNYGNDAHKKSVYNNMHLGYLKKNTVYIIPTKLENRDDVDQYINDGIDYRFCGFQSIIPKEKLGKIEKGELVLIWKNPDGTQELYYL